MTVEKTENGVSMCFDPRKGNGAAELSEMLNAWAVQAEKYRNGDVSREDYDKWRYRFPEFDTTQIWAKVPSKQLSDALVEAFKDKLKD